MMSGGDGVDMVRSYCKEVARVLCDGGRFIVITHQDPETEAALGVLQNAILPGLNHESADFPAGERTGSQKKKKAETKKTEESPSSRANPCWWTLDVHSMVTPVLPQTHHNPNPNPDPDPDLGGGGGWG
jgi:hypothetical protein